MCRVAVGNSIQNDRQTHNKSINQRIHRRLRATTVTFNSSLVLQVRLLLLCCGCYSRISRPPLFYLLLLTLTFVLSSTLARSLLTLFNSQPAQTTDRPHFSFENGNWQQTQTPTDAHHRSQLIALLDWMCPSPIAVKNVVVTNIVCQTFQNSFYVFDWHTNINSTAALFPLTVCDC